MEFRQTATLLAGACAALLLAALAADVSVGVADDRGKLAEDKGAAFFASRTGRRSDRGIGSRSPGTRPPDDNPRAGGTRSLHGERRGCRDSHRDRDRRPAAPGPSSTPPRQGISSLPSSARSRAPIARSRTSASAANQTSRFWRPQFSTRGTGLACATYARVLGQAYDALKAVDPITVLGVSLSPRGTTTRRRRRTPRPRPSSAFATWALRTARAAEAADHGRARLSPAPELEHGFVPGRLPVAERGDAEPRPDQASRVWDALRGTAQPVFAEAGRPVSRAALPPLRSV